VPGGAVFFSSELRVQFPKIELQPGAKDWQEAANSSGIRLTKTPLAHAVLKDLGQREIRTTNTENEIALNNWIYPDTNGFTPSTDSDNQLDRMDAFNRVSNYIFNHPSHSIETEINDRYLIAAVPESHRVPESEAIQVFAALVTLGVGALFKNIYKRKGIGK